MEKQLTDDEIIRKVHEMVADARTAQSTWRENAVRDMEFYVGDQWEDTVKADLEEQGRPALTINHVMPIVNQLSGTQRQNKKDIVVRPRKDGTQKVAEILTALAKHALDDTNAQYKTAEQFTHGAITAKGWLWVRIVDEADGEGKKLAIEHVPSLRVFEDPTATQYDLNTSGTHVAVASWAPKGEIRAVVPEAKHALLEATQSAVEDVTKELMQFLTDGETDDDEANLATMRKYKLLVYDAYWKEYVKFRTFTDIETGESKTTWKSLDVLRAASEAAPERFRLGPEKVMPVLHHARVCGGVVLEHTKDVFDGISLFPVIRFSPLWDEQNGRPISVVENLVGPQKEENKRRSQALHNLNQSANSGWITPLKALSKRMMDIVKSLGAKPGVVIEYDPSIGKPERITPMGISQGHLILASQAKEDMREISGVNTESLGYESKSGTSGRALALQQRQGQTTVEIDFDHFDYSSELLGTLLVQFIQHLGIYSEEEIVQIVDEADLVDRKMIAKAAESLGAPPEAPPPPPPQVQALAPQDAIMVQRAFEDQMKAFEAEMKAYVTTVRALAREELMRQLKDIKVGEYSCKVSQSANAPTQRMAHLATLVEIAKVYPGAIPPDVFIGATDLPNKDEIIARLVAPPQAQAEAPPGRGSPSAPQLGPPAAAARGFLP